MWLFDWLTGKIECPRCGKRGAKDVNGQIVCRNAACAYYSKPGERASPQTSSEESSQAGSVFGMDPAKAPAGYIGVQYRDFRGRERTFMADPTAATRVRNHLTLRLAPKHVKVSLSRDRILNLQEVEGAFRQRVAPSQDWPSPRERQILNYHKKHRTTSPLYEIVRAKYPDW